MSEQNDLVAVGRMVRQWRERVDPEDLPGFTARYGRRRGRGLTQEDVSHFAGFSTRWYSNLERGVSTPFSDEFLDCVSRVLGLTEDERLTLYTYTVGRTPPEGPQMDTSVIGPALARFVLMQPYPCYVSGPEWDILIHNAAASQQWRWMPHGVNVMIWALTYREARLQLVDWEQTWARPMAAQLHLAMRNNPDNARMREVVEEVRKDDVARRIYDESLANVHPDGSRRRVYLPHHHDQEFEVVFLCFSPMRDPRYRVMTVVPANECDSERFAVPVSRLLHAAS
ncbi:helix-turn-helix domain-containing protein [Streptomyces sp. NPDC053079]|uniref:helix-turn-helix domain-containing protein n=1 Tax=Streptomyces sp. NPDC053079 TaxID=3365697 RepID=UPI0037D319F0